MPNLTVSPDATGLSAFLSTPDFGRMARGRVPPAKAPSAAKTPRKQVRHATADTTAARIVLFRTDSPEPGLKRITAVFPCEPAMDGQMLGFAAKEGNVSCCQLWYDLSRPATEAESASLAAVLRRQGSTLDIRHRITPAMLTTRAWREEAERLETPRPSADEEDREPIVRQEVQDAAPAPVCPLSPEELAERGWRRDVGGVEHLAAWYSTDAYGIVRDPYGIPQTEAGFASPLARLDLHEDVPAVMAGVHIAMGLAAGAWAFLSGECSTAGRDVVICLTEDACPVSDGTLCEAFCVAEHELQPARDRVARRVANERGFASEFAEARAMITTGTVFFPWHQGDGRIPG